uniref:Envelope n=1 Tax=Orcinus orca TaxID=9733 RepID=D0E0H2_ORCOR|nr:envelope [Orcinus orca]
MVPTRRGLPTGNTRRNSSFPSRRLRIRPSASNPDVGTSMERTIHRPPHHPNGHKSGRHRCLDSCFTRESCTSDGIIRMVGPKNRQPAQTQASTNLRLIILILLPLLTVSDFSPHLPQRLTWQVISQTGGVTWSISHTAPPWTWWPDLFPDVCKLAIGAPYWDLEGYYDQHNAPSELLTRADYSGEGCKNQVRRSWLRTLSFYVCPGFHRPRSLNYKCGGTENFYCQNWGCETTGDTYWRPTSTWDFITVTANYTHTSYRGPQPVAPECSGWCQPFKISFSNPGKRDKEWINGHSWGIRFYKNGYDSGILMTLKLKIETPAPVSIGPNPVLGPPPLPPNPVLGAPLLPPAPKNNGTSGLKETTIKPGTRQDRMLSLVQAAFTVLNATNPEATKSCWLCYAAPPPYYDAIGYSSNYTNVSSPDHCRWKQEGNSKLTLSSVFGNGTCVGTPPQSHRHLCHDFSLPSGSGYLVPPQDGWWACNTGLTPCVSLEVLNTSADFCVLVQLVPRLIYHSDPSFLDEYEGRKKKKITLTLAMLLGLGITAGIGTGTTALIQQPQYYASLRQAVDIDLRALESSITQLKESLTSLSEVVLQNRRGLDLLFLKEGGLCAALKEECCFYIDHSGTITKTMDKLRERLDKRQRERENEKGWFQSWFDKSPWFTTLISTLLGPLIVLLLILTFGPCILNRLIAFIRGRISTVQVLMLRQQYQSLRTED